MLLNATTSLVNDLTLKEDTMKSYISILVAGLFALPANAELTSYVIGRAPQPVDIIKLEGITCNEILPIKGWVKFQHPNTVYQDVAKEGLWVKDDKFAQCRVQKIIEIYSKSEVDEYVNRLTVHRANADEKARKEFVDGLNKL